MVVARAVLADPVHKYHDRANGVGVFRQKGLEEEFRAGPVCVARDFLRLLGHVAKVCPRRVPDRPVGVYLRLGLGCSIAKKPW